MPVVHAVGFNMQCSSVLNANYSACRKVIGQIHDFHRQGGLTKQFEQLDKIVSSYLISPGEPEGQDEGIQVGNSLHADGRNSNGHMQSEQ